jgi:hypothetical protein
MHHQKKNHQMWEIHILMHLFKKCSNEEEAEYLTMAYNRE